MKFKVSIYFMSLQLYFKHFFASDMRAYLITVIITKYI